MKRRISFPLFNRTLAFFCGVFIGMSGVALAQIPATVIDFGAIDPIPAPGDIYCTNRPGNKVWQEGRGLAYYTYTFPPANTNPPGQTFSNSGPAMVVTSVAIRSAGLDNGVYPSTATPDGLGKPTGQQWYLQLYTISGTTATVIGWYSGTTCLTNDGDWFLWTGLSTALPANSLCAYTFGKHPNGVNNWLAMAVCSNNPDFFPGGQICLITRPASGIGGTGTVTYSPTNQPYFDGNFVIHMMVPCYPYVVMPTISPTNEIYSGSPVTLTEVSSCCAPITYQWQTDGGTGSSTVPGAFTNIPDATLSVLSNTIPPYNGSQTFVWYQCIVHNSCGTYTSPATNVIVDASSLPIDVQDPTPSPINAYVNGNVNFTAIFTGTPPIGFQWQTDAGQTGTYTNIPNQTNATIDLNNVQLSSSGNYRVVATNAVGGPVTSYPGELYVLADPSAPTWPADKFAYMVYTNSPVAYWRFEEQTPIFPLPPDSVQAYDYSGNNHMATYGSGCSIPNFGPQPPAFPGFEADNSCVLLVNNNPSFANSFLYAPPLNLNTNTATFTAWIKPSNSTIPAFCGLFMNRAGADAAGFGFGGNTLNGVAELGYTWNSNSPATYNFHSGLYPPSKQWSFVALTITPSNAALYLMYKDINTGQLKIYKAVNNISHIVEAFTNGDSWIGSDNYTDALDFPGFLDEVAVFNQSLGDSALQNLFFAGTLDYPPPPGLPCLTPQSITVVQGQPVQLTDTCISGGLPLSFQWQAGAVGSGVFTNVLDGGPEQISGPTTTTLTISNTLSSADYRLVVTNSSGSATSGVATVAVIPVPPGQWVANYCVTNLVGRYGLYHGRGVFGTGTCWNALAATNALFAENIIVTNVTSFRDDCITPTGIGVTVFSQGGTYSSPPDSPLLLLSQFLIGPNQILLTSVQNGLYHFCLFGTGGSYPQNSPTLFVIYGKTNTLLNLQDQVFALYDNFTIFTYVNITNNALQIDNYGFFNGLQIEPALAPPLLSVQKSGSNLILTWPDTTSSATLLEADDVTGPYSPTAGSPTSPYTLPPSATQKFYRLSIP